jgi:mannosyltransferase OCH1-like enzyme
MKSKTNWNQLFVFFLVLFVVCIAFYFVKIRISQLHPSNTNKNYENFDSSSDKNPPKTNVIHNENALTIPKNIIQVWIDFHHKLDSSLEYPISYKGFVKTITEVNPTYHHMFFTQEKIEEFLKKEYPEYYQTYRKLPVNIQKVDFFRYIAMYHYGGFYFDLDITALEPLDELLSLECVFPIDNFIDANMCPVPRYKPYCEKNMDFLLGQYAFAARPRHDFIKKLIDGIHENIDNYIQLFKSNTYENHEFYIYQTTGPDYVTNQYIDYTTKENITILEYPIRQYFGKYARHSFKGSWKENLRN